MAKATKIIEVYYFGKTSHNDRMFITERGSINIIASNKGIATVVVSKDCETTAKNLAGCLETGGAVVNITHMLQSPLSCPWQIV